MHPVVAIVGRANVGKSRLFNRLVGGARAIVADTPGITRDRHYAHADWDGREYIAVDTGGIEFDPASDLEKRVSEQSLRAIAEADVIIALFDGEAGPQGDDEELLKRLRRVGRPVVYAVNKIDGEGRESFTAPFHRFGVQPLVAVSAEHGRGISELLDCVVVQLDRAMGVSLRGDNLGRGNPSPPTSSGLPHPVAASETSHRSENLRIAIIGRPNVGKSTLINRLAGSERVVAHETPGTTRDAIDVEIFVDKKSYVLIDTAGIKRRPRLTTDVDRTTALRSLKTVERSSIVCLMIDAAEGLTHQDLHLADFAYEEGKGLILLVNKWDLVKQDWKEYADELVYKMGAMGGVPVIKLSAKTGQGVRELLPEIDRVEKAMGASLSTAQLNQVLENAGAEHHLPAYRGKLMRMYYGTQVKTHPPTFLVFVSDPKGIPMAYRRYLSHRLHEALGTKAAQVRLVFKRKE